MKAEKGVPKSPPRHDDTPSKARVSTETSGAGEGARKHGSSLLDEQTCANDDEDEDD